MQTTSKKAKVLLSQIFRQEVKDEAVDYFFKY